MVHAVILAVSQGFEVRVEAHAGQSGSTSIARDEDVLVAVARAFDRMMVAELGVASPPLKLQALPGLATRIRLAQVADEMIYKQGSC